MVVDYFNMPSFYSFLKKQLLMEGPYNAYMWYLAPYTFSFRHSITGAFAFGFISGLVLSAFFPPIKIAYLSVLLVYFSLSLLSSFQLSTTYKSRKHIFTLPIAFFLFHFCHGFGVLRGLFLLLMKKSPVQKISEPWPSYGKYRVKV